MGSADPESARPAGAHGLGRKAAWWAEDYASAIGSLWQARRTASRPEDFTTGHRRTVVLAPGIYEDWRFLLPLIRSVHAAGHPVLVLPELGRNTASVESGARILARTVRDAGLDSAIVLAHSKGGLIGKYAMATLDPDQKLVRMIAVCTPFGGSRYARYLPGRALRDLSPRSASTVALSRERVVNARIVSVYGLFDPHVPEGSELAGATNIRLPVAGHFRILSDPRTFAVVHELLAET